MAILRAYARAHPRVCGENRCGVEFKTPALGSSPRVRGKHSGVWKKFNLWGLIPACAGKTSNIDCLVHKNQAHPRVCGENQHRPARSTPLKGSSPRVRGKQDSPVEMLDGSGLIPACAGKTFEVRKPPSVHPAHPRVCGENVTDSVVKIVDLGSSPRVRGKLPRIAEKVFDRGLIPACAGKTLSTVSNTWAAWAHPRVCGENYIGIEPI